MKALRKILAFMVCLLGLLLPSRLRVLYSEALGWITQFVYLNYIVILKFIIKELDVSNKEAKANE